MYVKTFFCAVIIFFLSVLSVFAQDPKIVDSNIKEVSGEYQIIINLSMSILPEKSAAVLKPDNFYVVDFTDIPRVYAVKNPRFPKTPPDSQPIDFVIMFELDIPAGQRIDLLNRKLAINIKSLSGEVTSAKTPLQSVLTPTPDAKNQNAHLTNNPRQFAVMPTDIPRFRPTKASTRDDADIYLSNSFTGASGDKVIYAVDAKLSYPFYINAFDKKVVRLSPLFDLKTTNNPKADPDTLKIGLETSFGLIKPTDTLFKGLTWRNSPRIEADRDFDNVNFIFDTRFRAALVLVNNRAATIQAFPFIGTELGKNIESISRKTDGASVTRVYFGSDLHIIFPFQVGDLDILTLDATYIRRFPLKTEVTFRLDDKGVPKNLFIGTNPRDDIQAKLNINFNQFFAGLISYEYGYQPPAFKLVDHKYQIGLVYKLKFKDASK